MCHKKVNLKIVIIKKKLKRIIKMFKGVKKDIIRMQHKCKAKCESLDKRL